ncbi:MAG TPA: sulfotransferase, partial [Candidatus Paceibacterota bacterium]
MSNNFKIDFIGIGAAKSGTTWIARMLEEHPNVCMSEPKEVAYFNELHRQGKQYFYRDKEKSMYNPDFHKPLSWYARHFAHCKHGQKKGEFSPVYFYDEKAAAEIKKHFPDAKLIVCLRNPIDRAYSDYWMIRETFKLEKSSFEEALQNDPLHIEKGLYFKQLSRYLKLFPREQIHIIFYDDIKEKPENTIRALYAFLGVNSSFIPRGVLRRSNWSKKARFKGIVQRMDLAVRFLTAARLGFVVRVLKYCGI